MSLDMPCKCLNSRNASTTSCNGMGPEHGPGSDDEWDKCDKDEESLFSMSPPKQPVKKAKTTSSRPDLPLFNVTWDSWYEAMKVLKAQATQIHIKGRVELPILDCLITDGSTKPAKWQKKPGRPHKKRIRGKGGKDGVVPHICKCTHCGEARHYVRRCVKPPPGLVAA